MRKNGNIEADRDSTPQRLCVLDSVRGVAALIVVIHHCLLTLPAFSDYFFSTWRTSASGVFQTIMFDTPGRVLWAGFEAVTLFYVLSGLVLALPWIQGRPPRYDTFAIKRICRIYLPYLVTMAIASALAAACSSSMNIAGMSRWFSQWGWSNNITGVVLLDAAVMGGAYNFINGAVHSLIWELRVSVIFPLLVWPIVRWRLRGAAVVMTVLVGIFAVARRLEYGSFAPAGANPGSGVLANVGFIAYYATFFVLGIVIALNLTPLRRWMTALRGPARAGLLATGLGIMMTHWTRMNLVQALVVGIGASIVLIAALSPGRIERVLSLQPLRWLGKISYALYLIHLPLLLVSVVALHGILPHAVILILVPFVSIALAWLFNEWVIEPSVKLGNTLARMWLSAFAPVKQGEPLFESSLTGSVADSPDVVNQRR
ncbi:acyltransferase family protein [Paraburkholderia sp. RL17-337-BIB-A]|uniref:acyltransferase family protein n=1 Tax=Paraburkholderia sp. RL17-337-BIB-A TaxID=3031636 RepID=UPI0038BAC862